MVAVVTGGSSGIGAAVARRLSTRGWRCVLLARGEERLRAVAAELEGEWEVCDVGDRDAVAAVAARVRGRHPQIGLLVNGAGIAGRITFLGADAERIEQVLRINYLGSVWATRSFLPALEAGRPAHVVNIVSVAGSVVARGAGPYCAAKHAQLAFSRAVALELAPRGVAVHTVSPGFVATEGFPQTRLLEHRLLRRLVIDPDVVARRVVAAVERDRSETFVPGWYRPAAVVQALVPGTLARVQAARQRRKRRG